MTGKARGRRTASGILGRNKDDINKLFNVRTRSKIVTPTQVTLPSGATNTGSQGNYLPLSGGVMQGPIGSLAFSRAIDTGDLDLTTDDNGDSINEMAIIFVSPETGTSDTLSTITISKGFPMGGRILLVGVSGNTIGISVSAATSGLTKGIMVDGGSDQELGSTEVIELFYDIVSDKFHIIGNYSQTQIIDGDTIVTVVDSVPQITVRLNNVLVSTWELDGSGNEVLTMEGAYLDMGGNDILDGVGGSEIGNATTPFTAVYTNKLNVFTEANTEAEIELYRDDSTPGDGDVVSRIDFQGENSASEKITYAGILAQAEDVTDATEDGSISFYTYSVGNTAVRFEINGDTKSLNVYGGWSLKSADTTEIGLQVTNGTLTVGSKGSIEAPYLAQTDTPTDGTLDGFFGNTDGCMGFWRDVDSDANSRGFVRMNSVWYYWFLANL
ncbi:hypothetical protein [Nitrososphaeria virus YSH_462411]|uniref:Uncharacterized protein n=1 Tax=Nitrososphaeria virus YSH_462411 TaxID=3071321 RepID=A0A976UAJ9_9CAUD|nr:hypothetical protein QKV92_gp71 [Yangshan Harbor Nitrososphaeria virus]UVF62343.1 hypothetical protein [Nitrososphaeria virus YSH_462411]